MHIKLKWVEYFALPFSVAMQTLDSNKVFLQGWSSPWSHSVKRGLFTTLVYPSTKCWQTPDKMWIWWILTFSGCIIFLCSSRKIKMQKQSVGHMGKLSSTPNMTDRGIQYLWQPFILYRGSYHSHLMFKRKSVSLKTHFSLIIATKGIKYPLLSLQSPE